MAATLKEVIQGELDRLKTERATLVSEHETVLKAKDDEIQAVEEKLTHFASWLHLEADKAREAISGFFARFKL